MSDEQTVSAEAGNVDINFDCPYCGKNLEIDSRGAGLFITCPDCNQNVQVPVPASTDEVVEAPVVNAAELQERVASLEKALANAQDKIARLVENLEEVRDRRTYLEKLRTDNIARFDRVGGELTVIQAAMDRIVSLLQEVSAEKGTSP